MRLRGALTIALGALALTACTPVSQGNPTAVESGSPRTTESTSDSSPESSTSASRAGAPEVKNPVDVEKFVGDPCLALTSAQLSELGVNQGTSKESQVGKVCDWRNDDLAYINVAFLTNPDGLDFVYDNQRRANYYKYFLEMPSIEGLPVVAADTSDSRESRGQCSLFIGAGPDRVVNLYTAPSRSKVGQTEACALSTRVARMILQTVKAGG